MERERETNDDTKTIAHDKNQITKSANFIKLKDTIQKITNGRVVLIHLNQTQAFLFDQEQQPQSKKKFVLPT